MIVSEAERAIVLVEEINILRSRLQPTDTGHLHTTINVLEQRVKEIKEKLTK